MAVREGPFQRIVDVYFPEEGGGGGGPYPTQVSVAVYYSGYFYDGDPPSNFNHVLGGTVSNITDGTSQYVRAMAPMTPETIETPPDVEGGLIYDPEQDRNYRVITRVTGERPQYNPDTSPFINWTDATNLQTYDGANIICPVWTVVYREYYFFLGIYSNVLISSVQSTVSFSCTSVRLRSIDGVLYRGVSFNPDNGNIIVAKV